MHQKNQDQLLEGADHASSPHIPVLASAVLHYLKPEVGQSYLDVTAGYGGHARAILERTLQPERATLVDRDQYATAYLSQNFGKSGTQIIHKDFLSASAKLVAEDRQFDMILADLGVSSPHLDRANRGFTFSTEGPLDMRMDERQELTAESLVNNWSQQKLEELIRAYGEDPKARTIARLIVEHRPIQTTTELATIVARAWPGRSRVHPATRTFQALRIEVNDELAQLEQSLPLWMDLLAPGGRLAVISFHSLEDRLVKTFFMEHGGNRYDAQLRLLTKKPIQGDPNEIASNPRARSARLRAVAKIKTNKERN